MYMYICKQMMPFCCFGKKKTQMIWEKQYRLHDAMRIMNLQIHLAASKIWQGKTECTNHQKDK